MITGIGVTLLITGILCYVVVENLNPNCLPWKKILIDFLIMLGAVLTLVGYFE
jgi:hypothetical protein